MKTRTFNTPSNVEDAATTSATGSCGAEASSAASARGLGISWLGMGALGVALSVITLRRTVTASR